MKARLTLFCALVFAAYSQPAFAGYSLDISVSALNLPATSLIELTGDQSSSLASNPSTWNKSADESQVSFLKKWKENRKKKKAEKERIRLEDEQEKAEKRQEYLNSYSYDLTVDQISNEFEANSARAEDKYMGKRIRVTGIVGMVDDAPFGKSIIFTIKGRSRLDCSFGSCSTIESDNSVACYLDRKKKQYARFNRGDNVIMVGTMNSEELGVTFKDCIFP